MQRDDAHLVLDAVNFVILRVHRTDKHVVGDVIQVSAELEPRASHGDVVSRTLALCLTETNKITVKKKDRGWERECGGTGRRGDGREERH